MNIEEQLKELSHQNCPRQVDVVDRVMAEVRQHPYLIPTAAAETRRAVTPIKKVLWRRIAMTAAAAVAALVVFNIAVAPSYNEEQIGTMLAYVYDYDNYASVESAAPSPIDYLYDGGSFSESE